MSKQAFIEFCAKASENSVLEEQIANASSAEAIVALGAANGFSFSEEELQQSAQKLGDGGDVELSPELLTAVSGGSFRFNLGRIIKKMYPVCRPRRF